MNIKLLSGGGSGRRGYGGSGGGASGLFWQNPIISIFDNSLALPAAPANGNRYIALVSGPSNQMKGYYRGDNDPTDSSGLGHDAIWQKTGGGAGQCDPAYEAGIVNNCFKFTEALGVWTSYCRVLYNVDMNLGGADRFAIEFYFRSCWTSSHPLIQKSMVFQVGTEFIINADFDGGLSVSFGGANIQTWAAQWTAGNWCDVKFTYNNGVWELYNAGVLQIPVVYKNLPINQANHFDWLFGYCPQIGPLRYADIDELKFYKIYIGASWIMNHIYQYSTALGLWLDTSPVHGMVVYNLSTNTLYGYDGGAWILL